MPSCRCWPERSRRFAPWRTPRRQDRSPGRRDERAGRGERRRLTAVAMSGGLDSSVAAWLLASRGEPVVGLSMLLWDRSGRARFTAAAARRSIWGRAAGRRAGRHPALHAADGRGVPRARRRSVRAATTSPAARRRPACAATPSSSSTCCSSARARLGAQRGRHRPLRAHRRRAGRAGAPHRGRPRQGPELLPLRAHAASSSRRAAFPLGEMTKPEVRELARRGRPRRGREGREHGGLLRLRRRARVRRGARSPSIRSATRAAPPPSRRRCARRPAKSSARGAVLSLHRRPAPGSRSGGGQAALRAGRSLPEENAVVVGDEAELLAPGLAGERLHWIGEPVPQVRSRRR